MTISFRVYGCLSAALLVAFSGLPMAHAQSADIAPSPAVSSPQSVAVNKHDMHDRVFAIINGRAIPTSEYEAAFTSLVRQRFYHGQIPESELAAVREEIKTKLVQRIVLLEEAERRKILPDENLIDESVSAYDKRYVNNPQWLQNRDVVIPELRRQLAEQSLVAQLDKQIRDVALPTDAEVRDFYAKKPELFTEPEKLRLAAILLAVDPASPATAWEATREEAKAIYARLMGGADYEEAARMHSSINAEKSGDMGYLHRGMLPETIQEKIDKFETGKINEPIDTLEGVAIFRLLDRVPAKPRAFDDVATRARELLIRERQDVAWKSLIDGLVAKADIKFMFAVANEHREGEKK